MRRAAARFSQRQHGFDLEVAPLHARNLIDFFWTPSGRRRTHSDGIYAGHFFADQGEWRSYRRAPSRPNAHYAAMSAQLVHISIKRNQRSVVVNFGVDLAGIVDDLNRTWDCFLTALAGTEWPVRFRKRLARWQQMR